MDRSIDLLPQLIHALRWLVCTSGNGGPGGHREYMTAKYSYFNTPPGPEYGAVTIKIPKKMCSPGIKEASKKETAAAMLTASRVTGKRSQMGRNGRTASAAVSTSWLTANAGERQCGKTAAREYGMHGKMVVRRRERQMVRRIDWRENNSGSPSSMRQWFGESAAKQYDDGFGRFNGGPTKKPAHTVRRRREIEMALPGAKICPDIEQSPAGPVVP
ncbi:hypothetical protein GGX14DRAFT_398658 [Mycena pura]|uniref:Uncharacterized protein n=1 Tax=Mycena pura TaxID=153505 RepID=A0AAD6V9R9_9AGAR|nr:hypothetical protein GGX14DRAFT_398658 [Mycena pura]